MKSHCEKQSCNRGNSHNCRYLSSNYEKQSQLQETVTIVRLIIKVAIMRKVADMKSHCEKQSYTRNYKKIYIT